MTVTYKNSAITYYLSADNVHIANSYKFKSREDMANILSLIRNAALE